MLIGPSGCAINSGFHDLVGQAPAFIRTRLHGTNAGPSGDALVAEFVTIRSAWAYHLIGPGTLAHGALLTIFQEKGSAFAGVIEHPSSYGVIFAFSHSPSG